MSRTCILRQLQQGGGACTKLQPNSTTSLERNAAATKWCKWGCCCPLVLWCTGCSSTLEGANHSQIPTLSRSLAAIETCKRRYLKAGQMIPSKSKPDWEAPPGIQKAFLQLRPRWFVNFELIVAFLSRSFWCITHTREHPGTDTPRPTRPPSVLFQGNLTTKQDWRHWRTHSKIQKTHFLNCETISQLNISKLNFNQFVLIIFLITRWMVFLSKLSDELSLYFW